MIQFIKNYFYKRSIKHLIKDLRKEINIVHSTLNFEYMFTMNPREFNNITLAIHDLTKLYSKSSASIQEDIHLKTFLTDDPNKYNSLDDYRKECMRTEIIIYVFKNFPNNFKQLTLKKYYKLRYNKIMKEI